MQPELQWNEMQQVGTDYTDLAEVARYDQRMGQFRDVAAENAEILGELDLAPASRVLEIGTGTGRFARDAARAGHAVTAIDVSPMMLEYCAGWARDEGLPAMRFQHSGFLTLDFEPGSFDAAVSCAALHHLPDVWKLVGLQNVRRVLRPGGRFVLRDVVFYPGDGGVVPCFEALVNSCPESMRPEAVRHVAREFSTLGWIMEGLLERAGFRILRVGHERGVLVHYLCERAD